MQGQNKKVFFIPGWMDKAEFRVKYPGIDIWGKSIDPKEKIDADYIVADSLGCHFALLNWEYNKNVKLILVDPLLAKRGVFSWLARWLKFLVSEGTDFHKRRTIFILKHLATGCVRCVKLIKSDIISILNIIPPENIIIIHGELDNLYSDPKIVDKLEKRGIEFIEVKEKGHNWRGDINQIVENVIN